MLRMPVRVLFLFSLLLFSLLCLSALAGAQIADQPVACQTACNVPSPLIMRAHHIVSDKKLDEFGAEITAIYTCRIQVQ